MNEAARVNPAQPARYAKLLFAAAVLVALSPLIATPRPRLWLTLIAGWCGSAALAHFAWAFRRGARAALESARIAQGRIVERRDDGNHTFTMPAAGTEPWASDAFIVWVASAAAAGGGALLDSGDRVLTGCLVVLLAVLGLRLATASSDRLRFEISDRRWSVDALVSGRAIHRSGAGALLPELLAESLVLWSDEGRVGVLRGELEPEERAWLSERFTSLIAESSAIPGEANREVDQRKTDDQRQEQEAEGGD
jgi:hypothetical protein